jgi:hypothetical protein
MTYFYCVVLIALIVIPGLHVFHLFFIVISSFYILIPFLFSFPLYSHSLFYIVVPLFFIVVPLFFIVIPTSGGIRVNQQKRPSKKHLPAGKKDYFTFYEQTIYVTSLLVKSPSTQGTTNNICR